MTLQYKRTLYPLFPCKIHLLTVQYSVEKAAWNSFILNIDCMTTFSLPVVLCSWQDHFDINIVYSGLPLCLRPSRSHFLLVNSVTWTHFPSEFLTFINSSVTIVYSNGQLIFSFRLTAFGYFFLVSDLSSFIWKSILSFCFTSSWVLLFL